MCVDQCFWFGENLQLLSEKETMPTVKRFSSDRQEWQSQPLLGVHENSYAGNPAIVRRWQVSAAIALMFQGKCQVFVGVFGLVG